MKQNLRWWLVSNLSFILTGWAVWSGFAGQIIATDVTRISLGIVIAYLVMTVVIGFCIHTGRKAPDYWAAYLIGVFPALGLIGTLVGIVNLFGLGGSEVDLANNPAMLTGLSTAIFTTLTGLVFSEFLFLQMKVLERG